MDEADLAICRALLENSRAPYTELGKALGMTPQAVHRRVQDLTREGIIIGTVTRLSPRALGKMWVMIHGWSRSASMNDALSKLSQNENIQVAMVASGNYIYVHGMAKDSADLASYVSSVQGAASIQEVQVGIVKSPPPASPDVLSQVDLRLIAALQLDTRKPVSRLATEAGITPKTARKRLERMQKEGLVQFSTHWRPDKLGDTISNIHLSVRNDAAPEKVAFVLIKKLAANVVRTFSFGNLPNQYIVTLWTKNINDMQRICLELEGSGLFSSVIPNIFREVRYYDDHQAKALEGMLRSIGGGRPGRGVRR